MDIGEDLTDTGFGTRWRIDVASPISTCDSRGQAGGGIKSIYCDLQKVRLIIILCGPNLSVISHSLSTKLATGTPQLEVSTISAPDEISSGTLMAFRGQNQIDIWEEVRSIANLVRSTVHQNKGTTEKGYFEANHPPPTEFSSFPYEYRFLTATLHPTLESTSQLQSCVISDLTIAQALLNKVTSLIYPTSHPDCLILDEDILHPSEVCSVTLFGPTSFTPSRISISPEYGQSVTNVSSSILS
jgi:hypothetical protein